MLLDVHLTDNHLWRSANPVEREIDELIHRFDEANGVARELVAKGKQRWDDEPIHRMAGEGVLNRIGDLATKLPGQVTAGIPSVPWRELKGMRNIVAHCAHKLDHELIWSSLQRDVPTVVTELHNWRLKEWRLGHFRQGIDGRRNDEGPEGIARRRDAGGPERTVRR